MAVRKLKIQRPRLLCLGAGGDDMAVLTAHHGIAAQQRLTMPEGLAQPVAGLKLFTQPGDQAQGGRIKPRRQCLQTRLTLSAAPGLLCHQTIKRRCEPL